MLKRSKPDLIKARTPISKKYTASTSGFGWKTFAGGTVAGTAAGVGGMYMAFGPEHQQQLENMKAQQENMKAMQEEVKKVHAQLNEQLQRQQTSQATVETQQNATKRAYNAKQYAYLHTMDQYIGTQNLEDLEKFLESSPDMHPAMLNQALHTALVTTPARKSWGVLGDTENKEKIIKVLIDHGASPHIAMQWAEERKDKPLSRWLQSRQDTVTADSQLLQATHNKNVKIADLHILQASHEAKNEALKIAAKNDDPVMVDLLMKHGATNFGEAAQHAPAFTHGWRNWAGDTWKTSTITPQSLRSATERPSGVYKTLMQAHLKQELPLEEPMSPVKEISPVEV